MPKNVKNKEAGELASFVQEEVEMGIRQWWQALKKEKKRKELIRAAQKLENRVDPSMPKKTLPKNRAVKQEIIGVEKKRELVKLGGAVYFIEKRLSKSVQKPNNSNR